MKTIKRAAHAIIGAAIFCGLLALMLAYFDVLTK